MRIVTGGAPFPDGFMLENKRPALRGVATVAGIVLGQQRRAAAPNGRTFMRVMTIAATHLALQHGMAVSQLELPFFVQVTLEAGVWGPFGIQNRMMGAAALIVDAPWAVTRFATDFRSVGSFGFQSRVRCGLEIAHDVGMTFGATLRADKFGAGNLRGDDDRARHGRAGDQADRSDCRAHKEQGGRATTEKLKKASS